MLFLSHISQKLLSKFGSHFSKLNSQLDVLALILQRNWNQSFIVATLWVLYSLWHVILTTPTDGGSHEHDINANLIKNIISSMEKRALTGTIFEILAFDNRGIFPICYQSHVHRLKRTIFEMYRKWYTRGVLRTLASHYDVGFCKTS